MKKTCPNLLKLTEIDMMEIINCNEDRFFRIDCINDFDQRIEIMNISVSMMNSVYA